MPRELEHIAELARAIGNAHTDAMLLQATAKGLASPWAELARRSSAHERVDRWMMGGMDCAPQHQARRWAGSLASSEVGARCAVLTGAPLRDASRRFVEVRRAGASTGRVLLVPLGESSDLLGYLLAAIETPPPTSGFLEALAALLTSAVQHNEIIGRVAAVSRRAHEDRDELREELREVVLPEGVVAKSRAMHSIFHELVPALARQPTTVLLRGESGTGKEVVARRLHELSPRASRPFLKVNCGALPEGLIESTLFGHERGAFTGASERHLGVFERAHGGTLLLDEVAELPLWAQVKVLRVLQEGEFERVGGTATLNTDARILAATHRDLEGMVDRGAFRRDLYYRLNVFPLTLPPLRERMEDLEALTLAILRRMSKRLGKRVPPVGAKVFAKLSRYSWPGNVRELENVLERALIMSSEAELEVVVGAARVDGPEGTTWAAGSRRIIEAALAACEGQIYGANGAAVRLGLKPSTLQSKMVKLGIRR